MEHEDFIIGEIFFTGSGIWRCTDKGQRIITAVHCDQNGELPEDWETEEKEVIFNKIDFGGCDIENRF